jgi:hypothetical protein
MEYGEKKQKFFILQVSFFKKRLIQNCKSPEGCSARRAYAMAAVFSRAGNGGSTVLSFPRPRACPRACPQVAGTAAATPSREGSLVLGYSQVEELPLTAVSDLRSAGRRLHAGTKFQHGRRPNCLTKS